MKTIYLLLALALFGLSGPASATSVTYEFSGDVPCAAPGQPSCGDFSAELTIDDAQVGTDLGLGVWEYAVSDVAYSFTAGGSYSVPAESIRASTTALSNTQVNLTILDASGVVIDTFWQFDTGGIDNTDLAALILLLTTDSSEPVDEVVLTDFTWGCDACVGEASLWSPATAASTIPTLPLLAVGLAGLGYARRRPVKVR